jgi:hypothetical protein
MGQVEGKVARGRGQLRPHREKEGVGVGSREAPCGRDERLLDQLDAFGQCHVGGGGRDGRGQRRDEDGEGSQIGVARVLPAEAMQAGCGAPRVAADESGYHLVDQEGVVARHSVSSVASSKPSPT